MHAPTTDATSSFIIDGICLLEDVPPITSSHISDAANRFNIDPWKICSHHYYLEKFAGRHLKFPVYAIWKSIRWMDSWFLDNPESGDYITSPQPVIHSFEQKNPLDRRYRSPEIRWDVICAICICVIKWILSDTGQYSRIQYVPDFIFKESQKLIEISPSHLNLHRINRREIELIRYIMKERTSAVIFGIPEISLTNLITQLREHTELTGEQYQLSMKVLNDCFMRSMVALTCSDEEILASVVEFVKSILVHGYISGNDDSRVSNLSHIISGWYKPKGQK